MIIYKDVISGDEIISDTFKLIEASDGLWEVDCRMITKGADNFVLEGANPSAEGEDADEGGEGEAQRVLDIEDQFRLNKIEGKPSKKAYQGEVKKFLKKTLEKLKEKGAPAEKIEQFQKTAPAAVKKILANYENYDMYMGESMEEDSMYVLVDYREDGVTPYATFFKYALEEYKV
ncbi:putative tctp family protein [Phaeomoniella chlamydospora]|uniref:Translationally-controlled tumor protein homolog n=1 Tax=Phaeomoniella chlamydospora TaxID=158046 RepID=A0A0G2E6F6_PHACM|nr:putative tctp family protein [Phaeomoniella chlamydospora]